MKKVLGRKEGRKRRDGEREIGKEGWKRGDGERDKQKKINRKADTQTQISSYMTYIYVKAMLSVNVGDIILVLPFYH